MIGDFFKFKCFFNITIGLLAHHRDISYIVDYKVINHEDSIFDIEDESIWHKAEFDNEKWKLNEIINSTGRKTMGNLYFEQWLKKKK